MTHRRHIILGLCLLLLGIAPALPACGGMLLAMDCCAEEVAAPAITHGDGQPPCVGHASEPTPEPDTVSADCCDVTSLQEEGEIAAFERSTGPSRVLLADAHPGHLADSSQGERPGVDPTVYSRSHDPGLFTLFSSLLL